MKKVICLFLLLLMFAVLLTGCKSAAEKELEEEREAANNLERQYQEQKEKYDSVQKDINDYRESVSRLDNAY